MTYQEKFDELQKAFSEKFDTYHKFQKKFSLRNNNANNLLIYKSEFEKASSDFQAFLITFKENNASPDDELGTMGKRCD